MAFSEEIKIKALVACGRRCCICHKFCGNNMEVHHILPQAQGGKDTFENAIPLCFDCHANVEHYNPKHPKGNKFTEKELIKHRDNWYHQIIEGVVTQNKIDELEPGQIFKTKDSDPPVLVRVFTGKQLLDQIGEPKGLHFDYDEPENEELKDVLLSFSGMIQDSLDILPDLNLPDQVSLGCELTAYINKLEKIGYFVFAGKSNAFIKSSLPSKSSDFNICIINVLKKDNPEIIYLNKESNETSI